VYWANRWPVVQLFGHNWKHEEKKRYLHYRKHLLRQIDLNQNSHLGPEKVIRCELEHIIHQSLGFKSLRSIRPCFSVWQQFNSPRQSSAAVAISFLTSYRLICSRKEAYDRFSKRQANPKPLHRLELFKPRNHWFVFQLHSNVKFKGTRVFESVRVSDWLESWKSKDYQLHTHEHSGEVPKRQHDNVAQWLVPHIWNRKFEGRIPSLHQLSCYCQYLSIRCKARTHFP